MLIPFVQQRVAPRLLQPMRVKLFHFERLISLCLNLCFRRPNGSRALRVGRYLLRLGHEHHSISGSLDVVKEFHDFNGGL